MRRFGDSRERIWWVTIAAVGGLLVAILVAGLVGLFFNRSVAEVTDEALRYDVELEDHGDDLRVAVLDVRHYHRNIMFSGPSRQAIEDFEGAYTVLQQEIDELEELGVRSSEAPQPDQFRTMAQEYYDGFRPAIDLYDSDPRAFERASDRGLMQLDELEGLAQEIDELGEEVSANSLGQVDRANATAHVVLLLAIGLLLLVGMALAYAAVRVVTEFRRLYERLADTSRAKTDFIADVSHELRTPLTILRGNAEIGLQMDQADLRQEVLEDILKESNKMSKMVEDLLLLARSDASSLPLNIQPVSIADFLADLSKHAETLARERGNTFEAKVGGRGYLEVDSARIEQAILILVDNASKYTPDGSRVTLASRTEHAELIIEVADRGPGVPEAELPQIFERFYRVDKRRSRKQGGAGLGLSIAKTIVEAHGGRMGAESRVGEGTRMSIRLPLGEDPDSWQPGEESPKRLSLK